MKDVVNKKEIHSRQLILLLLALISLTFLLTRVMCSPKFNLFKGCLNTGLYFTKVEEDYILFCLTRDLFSEM